MAINTDALKDRIGLLKILTIIVGIILVGFIGHSYYNDGRDEAFLSCVIICFIISFLWSLAIIIDVLPQSDVIRRIDMVYHMVASVFYLITLMCFVVSLIDYRTGDDKISTYLWERIFAFILGVANTSLYTYTSLLFFKSM